MEIDPEKLDQEAEKEGIKDEVEELFGDDEMIPEKKEKKKKKDELDEIYEKNQGDPEEDIYATEDFERYDDGVAD
jgi:hypothetical protein